MAYQNIVVDTVGRVGRVTLDRPAALNALDTATMREVVDAVTRFDADTAIGAILLGGSEKAFAAGADIKEMAAQSAVEMYLTDRFGDWEAVARARTPLVAAVAGYALGGGCELALMCDIVIAADTARFGQPETSLGIIPGMGGSQRLTRAVGKAKAMDLVLTGRMLDAVEAERAGLVSRVVPAADLAAEALAVAEAVAARSLVATMAAKEVVNAAFESSLEQGIRHERRVFQAIFASADRQEGMAAFVEKREPRFRHR